MTRLDKLKGIIKKSGCTHILVTDSVDIEYICGFKATSASLLVSLRTAFLCVDFRYYDAASRFCRKNREWKCLHVKGNLLSFIVSRLNRKTVLGLQSGVISLDKYLHLKKLISKKNRQIKLKPLGDKVEAVSYVKTKREISSMKKAAAMGDTALKKLVKYIKPGMKECEAAELLERFCREEGSEGPSFETIVLFGKSTALPHGIPSNRRLKNGDLILCDFGCTVNGFCSDMTRMLVMGRTSAKQRACYAVVQNAQKTCIQKIKAGITAAEADSFARDIIKKEGYGKHFGHAAGHGLGLRIHEQPRLASKCNIKLEKDMVVTVEPGIYITGKWGMRLEDMLVISSRDCRLLTESPREIIEV